MGKTFTWCNKMGEKANKIERQVDHPYTPRPFRFLKMSMRDPSCVDIVSEAWIIDEVRGQRVSLRKKRFRILLFFQRSGTNICLVFDKLKSLSWRLRLKSFMG